jgi:predicted alpha/beta-hydrolase family hydrolase
MVDADTPHGPARVHLQPAPRPRAALALGHGAGGSVSSPDLMVAARVALEEQVSVALVEQPYRVAGRKSQPQAGQLDTAWTAVVEHLANAELRDLPLIAGGRSAGARVACRTAASVGAIGVLCLAFPVHPPGAAGVPEKSRLAELDAVTVPVLVVQGKSDPFGMPGPGPNRVVVEVPGDHGLKTSLDAVADAIRAWLREVLG